MNKWLGASICWLLRKHKWRRLRKGEAITQPSDTEQWRKCSRCGLMRLTLKGKAAQ